MAETRSLRMLSSSVCGLVISLLLFASQTQQVALFEGTSEDDAVIAYENVRSDNNDINWVVLKYDGKTISSVQTGTNYDDMLVHFMDNARIYAYVRFETGDEMSRRAKFAFITWIGPSVSPLKKAKVSTDKAFVKAHWPQFGKEILADERSEVKYETVLKILETASGAAYGTGK